MYQRLGLLKLHSLISPLAKFSILQKYPLDSLYHITYLADVATAELWYLPNINMIVSR